MTPPKKECPLPGCNVSILEKIVSDGFKKLEKIQEKRTENDTWTKHLLDQSKVQNDINTQLFDKYSDILVRLGDKVDKSSLVNAMETVQLTYVQLKDDTKKLNDTLRSEIKFTMKVAIGVTTGVVTIIVGIAGIIIQLVSK